MDCQQGHSAQTVSIATITMEKINSANQLTAKSNGFQIMQKQAPINHTKCENISSTIV